MLSITSCLCLALTFTIGYSSSGYFPQQLHPLQQTQRQQPFYPTNQASTGFGLPLQNSGAINQQINNNANNRGGSNSAPSPSSANAGGTEFFDLSYTYDNNTIFYPGQRFSRFHLLMDISSTNRTPSNYQYSFNSFSVCFSEHGGTHIDAPFHFNRFGWKVAEIPLNRLVDVPTALIDVEHHVFALRDPSRFVLEVSHLQEHESRFGQIPRGALILINFGWGKFWPDWTRYTGWDNSTAGAGGPPFTFSYPSVSGNAAGWLLRERNIVGLGSDTLSPDVATTNPVVHILLLENQVYLLENVANLDSMVQRLRRQQVVNCDLRTYVLPIKSMGTGGPVRLVSSCKN